MHILEMLTLFCYLTEVFKTYINALWTKKNNSYTIGIVEMDALFEKEMVHSDQTLAKIAGCFTTDDRKNTTKRLCLSFLCYIIIKYHFNTLSQSQDTSKSWDLYVCVHM